MGYLTLSLSKFDSRKKAQFFVLSAFIIVSILYFLSQWMEPLRILDASHAVLMEEPFVFDNIKERAIAIVETSKNCEELKYNLEEYEMFVREYVLRKHMRLVFDYEIECEGEEWEVSFYLAISSPKVSIDSSFKASR